MSDTLKDLKARAEATRAEAAAVEAEAARQAGVAESLRAEAASRAEWARIAAEDVAAEELKLLLADSEAEAADLVAKADSLTARADKARAAFEDTAAAAAKARKDANVSVAKAAALKASIKPAGNYVRSESGGFVEVRTPYGPRDPQVIGVDGQVYDHVDDDPSGAWIYRGRGIARTN